MSIDQNVLLHSKFPMILFLTDPIHITYPSFWSVGDHDAPYRT